MKRVYKYGVFPTIGYATNWLNENPRYVLVSAYPEDGKIVIVYFHIENDKTSEDGNKEEAV